MASAPAPPPTIALPPFIPNIVGRVMIPPRLYHSTLIFGMDDWFRLKEPVMEK